MTIPDSLRLFVKLSERKTVNLAQVCGIEWYEHGATLLTPYADAISLNAAEVEALEKWFVTHGHSIR